MEKEILISNFNEKKGFHNLDFVPKEEQALAALAIANGKNCLCFLPTGFGKTLCYVINSIVHDHPSITLVISPLISLMEDQMKTLREWNFKVARIGDCSSEEDMKSGEYQFVFASPESALKPKWRCMFLTEACQCKMTLLVFDEAHCISEWGEDFRPEYKEMAQLCSFFKVPVMALTATSTEHIKNDIMSTLQLHIENTEIIYKSCNRPNIYLDCKKKKTFDYLEELDWIINYLKCNGKSAKKMIIYCRSIDTVSDIFITIRHSLGKNAYANQDEKSSNVIVEMFHKCTHDSSKGRILDEFKKPDSNIRCIIATVALGMGLDIKDVELIVHIGCPKSVISYWQEAGRCARDCRQGYSLILYDNFTAASKTTEKTCHKL